MAKSDQSPFAYTVGNQIEMDPGGCVCVRAVVPRKNKEPRYRPVSGWPEDSLMVDLVLTETKQPNGINDPLYRDSRVTVSVDMHTVRHTEKYNLYQGTAQLFDPGVYEIDARVEFQNYQWNVEPGQLTAPYNETIVSSESKIKVRYDPKHPTFVGRHQNLPLCTEGDSRGRWIPANNLRWPQWQHTMPVEDGRVWLPYHCRLRRISHMEFAFHMSIKYPAVHWYGDSNSRRTLRPFAMGGRWCHRKNTTLRLDCLCNDAPKDLFPSEWYPTMHTPHLYRIYGTGVNATEMFAKLDNSSATDPRPILDKDPVDAYLGPDYVPPGYRFRRDYFDLYYLFTRGTQDMFGSHWARDITPDRISNYPGASLVVVQMITWDVAFGTMKEFAQDTERLTQRLKKVYPGARFVYRSGPYWCCRNSEDQDKKYTRLRFHMFDQYARGVFKRRLGALVWDTMGPQAQRPPESKRLSENMPCRSAHSRSEVIHMDNQILMNMLVNQDKI
ncbi:hypothetical protein GGI25_006170 [Coemansia spiralis]|uniref:Uncharacterized protein n=2 Tax=Coemansia TaxID=4863 RepID=A0A9W8G2L3_9FUNG|nr:hypothetical protein EDC05_006075 [Coemansia umbellata]KAJ2618970.1 hypothetical protein GGI26_006209 [Coemansia sp. RSA 1358]KAJ2669370.1 hypothetical protein GGI25_006170 [Coemansia spiralis]